MPLNLPLPLLNADDLMGGRKTRPAVLTQSALRDLHRCSRLFMYRHRYWLRPRTLRESADAEALRIGTFGHAILCNMYCGMDLPAAIQSASSICESYIAENLACLSADGTDRKGRTAPVIRRLLEREYNKAAVAVTLFQQQYPIDPARFEVVAVEDAHRIHLAGITAEIGTGGFDLWLRERSTGHLWIADHKFIAPTRHLAEYVSGMAYDVQVWLSRLIAQVVRPSEHVAGFILNCIHKPGIVLSREDVKESELSQHTDAPMTPQEAYVARVRRWYADREHPPFLRGEYRYSGPVLSNEATRQLNSADILATSSVPVLHLYPRDPSRESCKSWNRTCPFHALCTTDELMWPELLDQRYEQSDPTARDTQANGELPDAD